MDFVQAVWQSVFTGERSTCDAVRRRPRTSSASSRGGPEQGVRGAPPADPDRKYDIGREEPLYVRRGNREVPREVAATDPRPARTPRPATGSPRSSTAGAPQEAAGGRPPPPGPDLRGDRRADSACTRARPAGDRRRSASGWRTGDGNEAPPPCRGATTAAPIVARRPAEPRRPRTGGRLRPVPAAWPGDGQPDPSAVRRPIACLAEFTARWERGESPRVEDYSDWLRRPARSSGRADLPRVLPGRGGRARPPTRPTTSRGSPARPRRWRGSSVCTTPLGSSGLGPGRAASPAPLPEVGDEIGPYRLIRELGRGGFARVFLAEQADLDDRLVVVKVSTRVDARARAAGPGEPPAHRRGALARRAPTAGPCSSSACRSSGGAPSPRSWPSAAAARARGRVRARPAGRPRPGLGRRVPAGRGRSRPARELIAGLSYPRAVGLGRRPARRGARLRLRPGRAHGDVKPSNVLLTADGTPMLLDFNLAVGWRVARPGAGGGRPTPAARSPTWPPSGSGAVADPDARAAPRRPTATGPTSIRSASCSWRCSPAAPELPPAGRAVARDLAADWPVAGRAAARC